MLQKISKEYRPHLEWVLGQQAFMTDLLETWGNINSGTSNLAGLASMLNALKKAFATLGGEMRELPLPSTKTVDSDGKPIEENFGSLLLITKHPETEFKVLLCGHMDTVYPIGSPFQKVQKTGEIMIGPGVTDMKGGLLIMLIALQALERSPFAGKIGWEVLINSNEEVGSPESEFFLREAAARNDVGLLYEPAFPDGAIVSTRKGSMNLTVVFKGKAAHSGRDFFQGRNAITAAARFALAVESLTNSDGTITVNIGSMKGGGPINIVPDTAVLGINKRITKSEDLAKMLNQIKELVEKSNAQEGISITLYEYSSRAPKPFDEKNTALFEKIKACAHEMDMDLTARPSGGVCDGNVLSEEGLPTIDTLGVIGGKIHTPQEYVMLNSLTERAALSAYFLMKLANEKSQK
jgi:glutamate carboxypeptidase